MSTTQIDQKLERRFRLHRGALGVSSVLLLVTGTANYFGWLSTYHVPESLMTSLQYVLVALVIFLSLSLQRSGNALQRKAQARQEAVTSEDAVNPAPVVPSGPEYASARRKATVFQVTAIVILAGSLIAVPVMGDLLMSSGASFTAFNAFMISIGALLIAAAATSKYFTHKAREAGRRSIKEQEESIS